MSLYYQAIVGQLAGAIYGYEKIPDNLLDALKVKFYSLSKHNLLNMYKLEFVDVDFSIMIPTTSLTKPPYVIDNIRNGMMNLSHFEQFCFSSRRFAI